MSFSFLSKLHGILPKLIQALQKNTAIQTCLLLKKYMVLQCVLEPNSKKKQSILTHLLRSKSCSMLISSYLVNKSMAREHVQKAFWVLADKLGKEEFDSSAMIVFWFLSFIFRVRVCIVRVSISKSKGHDFVFKKEIICCWRTKDVVDEIILNHSSKVDT
jgi:hypothetical protein